MAGIATTTLLVIGSPAVALAYATGNPNPATWRGLSWDALRTRLADCVAREGVHAVLGCPRPRTDHGPTVHVLVVTIQDPPPPAPPPARPHPVEPEPEHHETPHPVYNPTPGPSPLVSSHPSYHPTEHPWGSPRPSHEPGDD